jgi:hypothetical protein
LKLGLPAAPAHAPVERARTCPGHRVAEHKRVHVDGGGRLDLSSPVAIGEDVFRRARIRRAVPQMTARHGRAVRPHGEHGENDMTKQLSQDDLVRLMEIQEQMLALMRETEFLLDGSSEWARAKGYWLPHIRTALDNDHSYLGGSMFTMQDTIDALGKEFIG